MPTLKLGFECKLYIGTAGAAPANELSSISDVSLTLETPSVDATTRTAGAFKTYIPGMIDCGLEFKIHADSSDTNLGILRTQWLARGAVAVKVDLGDGTYFQSDMIIENFTNDQATEDIVAYTVSMKPTVTSSSFLPTIATASSGTGSSQTPA